MSTPFYPLFAEDPDLMADGSSGILLPPREGTPMQLAIMEFFQRISSPVLDVLVELMTMMGEETVFILAVAWFLWCGSKKRGFPWFRSKQQKTVWCNFFGTRNCVIFLHFFIDFIS